MDDNLVMSAWAPGMIGLTVSASMYGVTLGQSCYYARCFPHDSRILKLLALLILVVDTMHLIAGTQVHWSTLISCHRQYSQSCTDELPWGLAAGIVVNSVITFIVQCFYCHRLWIISGKSKWVTGVTVAVTISGLGFSLWYCVGSIQSGSIRYTLSSPFILPVAGLNTVGDFVITGSVFKYMWKSAFRKRYSAIHDMAVIFVNLGVFTCTISIILGIMWFTQGDNYWTVGAGIVLSRGYVNSMLAVLNARRVIRDRTAVMTIELSDVVYSFM